MTPEDLNNALQSAALTFVREVKQQDVPLRVNRERAVDIIRTTRYQHRDEVSLYSRSRIDQGFPWSLYEQKLLVHSSTVRRRSQASLNPTTRPVSLYIGRQAGPIGSKDLYVSTNS